MYPLYVIYLSFNILSVFSMFYSICKMYIMELIKNKFKSMKFQDIKILKLSSTPVGLVAHHQATNKPFSLI